ncbi:unnamed protein product [Sordaria macrospora k-hell]|uniref:WGS project CABT00000000 data, contig 2.29 n=1 Tax=Sordaria macrospora (strain ATCC MYA-333 / DSM 997 / K(L3346) / K-hell) TaxID=771870 RepID=F7W4U9_SORMK|nr:uncharacterized protein SMAC_06943 [Sordaria macrospora k-hell]CCC12536.1 unnamed protein product [Sordaria macrospora k-hell]
MNGEPSPPSPTDNPVDGEPIITEPVTVTDMVLIVGPDKERIPVESSSLKAASRVFAAMLSPPWLEINCKEVPLPVHDADAMRFIILTLSYDNENEFVNRLRTPQEILQIAMTVDKYHLRTALKFVLDYLFRQAGGDTFRPFVVEVVDREDLIYLCAAAYLLDRCENFSRYALDLLCYQVRSFTALMNDELINSILPAKFFGRSGSVVLLHCLAFLFCLLQLSFSTYPPTYVRTFGNARFESG